jgi:hypothetical protein
MENFASPGIRFPDRPAHSESPDPLCYPGPPFDTIQLWNCKNVSRISSSSSSSSSSHHHNHIIIILLHLLLLLLLLVVVIHTKICSWEAISRLTRIQFFAFHTTRSFNIMTKFSHQHRLQSSPVTSRTLSQRELTLQEYIDILKRSRWKFSTKVTKRKGVVTVLQTLDFSPWVETQPTSVKCYTPHSRQHPIGGARTYPAILGPT